MSMLTHVMETLACFLTVACLYVFYLLVFCAAFLVIGPFAVLFAALWAYTNMKYRD